MTVVAILACAVATYYANVRWLRVAQREHYIGGAVSRFVNRWWYGSLANIFLWSLAFVGIVLSSVIPEAIFLIALAIGIGPIGLSVKGRTSTVVWTRRLKTLAKATVLLEVTGFVLGWMLGVPAFAAGLVTVLAPTWVDIATFITAPFERREAKKFVESAQQRLKQVSPTVVAITGSYGKTTTKGCVAHLLSGSRSVLPTPASFNNLAGISRTINEQLTPGTDVFVAEMGTYGIGEIAELCDLAPPHISVITAIGPVHLERFGTEEQIVQAKSEIFEKAGVCIVNADDERLLQVADRLQAQGREVWRCSALNEGADVCVTVIDESIYVHHRAELIAEAPIPPVAATNVACAVAVALSLGVSPQDIARRLATLPGAPHRQEISHGSGGPTIIDDTYNSNPASVRRGLDLLARSADGDHRRVVATPGMVELGPRQSIENFQFAVAAAQKATDLVVIGRTNRKALLAGAKGSELNVVTVDHLPDAVEWVRRHVSEGDAVLYANDLPDHFP